MLNTPPELPLTHRAAMFARVGSSPLVPLADMAVEAQLTTIASLYTNQTFTLL